MSRCADKIAKNGIMKLNNSLMVVKITVQDFILQKLSEQLSMYQKNYGVKKIGVFGSYSRCEQKDQSDIDILVEFKENAITFDRYMDLKLHLQDTFDKPVDLVILEDIKPTLKPYILGSVKYAEGA